MAADSATRQTALSGIIKRARDIMRKDAGLNGDTDRIPQIAWLLFLKAFDDLEESREATDPNYAPALDEPYRWRDWAAEAETRRSGDAMLDFVNGDLLPHLAGLRGSGRPGDLRQSLADIFADTSNRMLSGYLLADLVDEVDKISFRSADDIHTMAHLYESMLREMRDAAGDAGEFYTPRPLIRFIVGRLDPQPGETVMDPATGTGGFLVEAWDHMASLATKPRQREKLTGSLSGFEKKPMPYLLGQMNMLLHGVDQPKIVRGNALRFKMADQRNSGVDVIATNPPFGGEEEASVRDFFPSDFRTDKTEWLFLQSVMARISKSKSGRVGIVVPNSVLSEDGVGARIKEDLLSRFNLHTVIRLPEGVFAPYTPIPTNVLFLDNSGPTKETWFYEVKPPEDRKHYTKTKPMRYEEFRTCEQWWDSGSADQRTATADAWCVPVADLLEKQGLDRRNPTTLASNIVREPNEILRDLVDATDQIASQLAEIKHTLAVSPVGYKVRECQMGDFLTLDVRSATVRPEQEYPNIGLLNKGRGVFVKSPLRGSDISYRTLYPITAGQLIYSKLFGWEGSVAMVPNDLDGYFVSSEFPHFFVDTDVIDPEYLKHMVTAPGFQHRMSLASKGMGQRRHRVNVDQFATIGIAIPRSLDTQRELAKAMTLLTQMRTLSSSTTNLADSLLVSGLSATFDKVIR
jgi:type I restriction enzyme M protein